MAAKKYPDTVPKSPELPPLSQHRILKPCRIWDRSASARQVSGSKEGVHNPKFWLQLDCCRRTRRGLSAVTYPSVGSSSSFLVQWMRGGGKPAATQGNTALCPGSRLRDEGGFSSTRLCGSSAAANGTPHSWHQVQNQKMVMIKTTKNPLNQDPTGPRKSQMKSLIPFLPFRRIQSPPHPQPLPALLPFPPDMQNDSPLLGFSLFQLPGKLFQLKITALKLVLPPGSRDLGKKKEALSLSSKPWASSRSLLRKYFYTLES